MTSKDPGHIHVRLGDVSDSNFSIGHGSQVHVYERQAAEALDPANDPVVAAIALIDRLIGEVERHWAEVKSADQVRGDLKEVRTQLKDGERDATRMGTRLSRISSRLAPVAVLAELASSISELISHLH